MSGRLKHIHRLRREFDPPPLFPKGPTHLPGGEHVRIGDGDIGRLEKGNVEDVLVEEVGSQRLADEAVRVERRVGVANQVRRLLQVHQSVHQGGT